MKKYAYFVFFSFLLINSCKQETSNLLDFSKIENLFKYKNLTEFSLDTLDWMQRKNFYERVDSISFKQIVQDTTEECTCATEGDPNCDFYFSKHETKRGLVEFTILTQREGEYIDRINYFIYGRDGKLISSFLVASGGGDGGYAQTSWGHFLNDHTYELFMEERDDFDSAPSNSVTQTKIVTVINNDGSIMQSKKVTKVQEELNLKSASDTSKRDTLGSEQQ